MPKRVTMRRGTTAEHGTFTGALGELTVDTTRKAIVVHDGVTVGGVPGARFDEAVVVLAMTPNEDQTGKEGYGVKVVNGKAALITSDVDVPLGLILTGGPTTGTSLIAVADAYAGRVRAKLDAACGTVGIGTYLTVTPTGTFRAAVSGKTQFVRALAAGTAGQLVDAVLSYPMPAA